MYYKHMLVEKLSYIQGRSCQGSCKDGLELALDRVHDLCALVYKAWAIGSRSAPESLYIHSASHDVP
jgi:hypothetical protein